jgi:hypothetical protein
MRWVFTSLALLAPLAAFAGKDPALVRQKEQLVELREHDREVRRIARKFDRAVRRDRDDERRALLDDLAEVSRVELVRLRSQGITTRERLVPGQPRKVLPAEHPYRQELWDALVRLDDVAARDHAAAGERAVRLLEVVEEHVGARRELAERRYDAAKDRA